MKTLLEDTECGSLLKNGLLYRNVPTGLQSQIEIFNAWKTYFEFFVSFMAGSLLTFTFIICIT